MRAEPGGEGGACAADAGAGDGHWGEERGGAGEGFVAWGGAVGLEEIDEVGLVLLAQAFEVEDFAEVGVGFVGDVDQIGLY